MDLENRLLEGLSIYHPQLETFAKAREAVYQVRQDPTDPAHQLIDEACEHYLMELADQLVPKDASQDAAAIDSLERRKEVLRRLGDIPEYRNQLIFGRGLVVAIIGWAAAQAFGRWGNKPWKLLVELLLDSDPHDPLTYPEGQK